MLTVLNPHDRGQPFPEVERALVEPNGLLAVGGCLAPRRLITAYRNGIFPWYAEGEPILWWSPDPRLILRPGGFKLSRSMARYLQRKPFRYSFDRVFDPVVEACAEPRCYGTGTWLNADMKRAYGELHRLGVAHSFEAWQHDGLVGGIYGVAIGRVFFGESMFHRVSNASKAAMAYACACLDHWGFVLIDCQVYTPHLASLGAEEIPRCDFIGQIERYCDAAPAKQAWSEGAPGWA